MSKERLEELHEFYVIRTLSAEELIEEVVGLEWINDVLINQIKRYRETLEEIARGRFPGASYEARKALEGDEKYIKKHYTVVCLAENRLDVKDDE